MCCQHPSLIIRSRSIFAICGAGDDIPARILRQGVIRRLCHALNLGKVSGVDFRPRCIKPAIGGKQAIPQGKLHLPIGLYHPQGEPLDC